MLNRKRNPDGIYKIPYILEMSCERITSSDKKLTTAAVANFERLCNQVPIYTPKDLVKLYQTEFPDMTEEEVGESKIIFI